MLKINNILPAFIKETISLDVYGDINQYTNENKELMIYLNISEAWGEKININKSPSDYNEHKIYFDLSNIEDLKAESYYQFQLLDQDKNNISNYGIAKCINEPIVELREIEDNDIGFLATFNYTVSEGDKNELLYSTQFQLFKSGNNIPLEESDELIYNYTNNKATNLQIQYQFNKYIVEGTYIVKVIYKTINNYCSFIEAEYTVSRVDQIINIENKQPNENITIEYGTNDKLFSAYYNKENAVITIGLNDNNSLAVDETTQFTGKLYKKEKNGLFFMGDITKGTPIIKDLCIEQFNPYDYYVLNINGTGIINGQEVEITGGQQLTITADMIDFDHMYLFDENKQLCIKFNPKINSFKSVSQENKINTIGSQYPYIFKNGKTNYKEFDISGLIALDIDLNNYFIESDQNLSRDSRQHTPASDNVSSISIGKEYYQERQMKMEVLNWLNNGKPKVFKSATEGNYIVQLTGVSLTPEEKLSRKLCSFKCLATEIAPYNLAELKKYNLFKFQS